MIRSEALMRGPTTLYKVERPPPPSSPLVPPPLHQKVHRCTQHDNLPFSDVAECVHEASFKSDASVFSKMPPGHLEAARGWSSYFFGRGIPEVNEVGQGTMVRQVTRVYLHVGHCKAGERHDPAG